MPNTPSQYGKMTYDDLPTSKVEMCLKCKSCGKAATYKVGRIILDPDYVQELRHEDPAESLRLLKKVAWAKWVCFTGYFLCRHCGSGGPWAFSSDAKHQMMRMMIRRAVTRTSPEVFLGRVTLFDGTAPRTPYEGAEHLKCLLANDPNNAYLWNRLGNIFIGADEPVLAAPAFQRAVELNPRDVESLHSLGAYWFDRGDDDQAAHCLNQVLHLCRDVTWYNACLKEKVVRDALERLIEIQQRTGGRIKMILPPVQPGQGVVQFELSSEDDMRRLVHSLLTGSPLKSTPIAQGQDKRLPFAGDPAPRLPRVSERETAQRVGRNDRCPCGSGEKFKHCCYRK